MTAPIVWIGNPAMRAGISPVGAALWDLRLSGIDHPLVVGFDDAVAYRASGTHAGAIVGRVCNRLRNARAPLGARVLTLARNLGPHHVHGGPTGFSLQDWTVERHAPARLDLSLVSPDGHEGYPGAVSVRASYKISGTALELDLRASTDAATLLNLCHHPYFNLSGQPTIDDHRLWLASTRSLETDEDGCPTGVIEDAAKNGERDYRTRPRRLAAQSSPLDRTFLLAQRARARPQRAAVLEAGVRMELWTTQTALHVYDGAKIRAGLPLRGGRVAAPRAGICLEAQGWTDAPNHADFPSIVLEPGAPWRHRTIYRFSHPQP